MATIGTIRRRPNWHRAATTYERDYDIRDGASAQVFINQWYGAPLSSGSPGPLQNFDYSGLGAGEVVSGYWKGRTWSGRIAVIGDVTIMGNLTIAAGTEVLFDPLHDAAAGGIDASRSELILQGGSLLWTA